MSILTVNPNLGGEFGPLNDTDLYVNPNYGGALAPATATGPVVNANYGGALRVRPVFTADRTAELPEFAAVAPAAWEAVAA
ncbi:hypothetical protein [Propionicicella superfundia]|uniref:hypothetical protein n=1 Tax=Propionicicella superfundia TaxID=348582 RepID=UPI0012EC455E|nr:hypothetical protein [Propionicicella superfundia]